MKKVLITATVQSHICQFHRPLINMLKKHGYEVHVAARNNLAEKNGLKLENVDVVFDVPFSRSPLDKKNVIAYKRIKKILKTNRYDIVHCNTPTGGVVTRLAARKHRKIGTRVFYTAHGFHFYKGASLKNWIMYYPIEKVMARYTDKLITITKEDYNLAKTKNFKTEICYMHGVGVNDKRYFPIDDLRKNIQRQELGYGRKSFICLCVGELNRNKNQSFLIRCVVEIIKEIPDFKLLLAGNGPNEEALGNLAEELGISSYIDFLGYRTDLERYMQIADVVLTASFREGMPLNVIEAMLCKKPVVASINRGHRELVVDGVTGYLVDVGNIQPLVKYVVKLYQDSSANESFGEQAISFAQPFTEENVVNELKVIYEVK